MAIMFSEYYFYFLGFIEDINKEEAFENPDDIFSKIYRIDRIQELEVLDEQTGLKKENFANVCNLCMAGSFGK